MEGLSAFFILGWLMTVLMRRYIWGQPWITMAGRRQH